MSTTSPTPPRHRVVRPRRRRGRTATHDLEALLDLVAVVVRAAVAAGLAPTPKDVSMPVFNRVKLQVDRARGIADPGTNSERTPTAEAIQMRFKEAAGRPVRWDEVLNGALRTGRQRTMWLSAQGREEARDDLTDSLVIHALRLVAARRDAGGLTREQYIETRDELVTRDRQLHGEDGLLEQLLPTANQILAHCELRWEKALRLADMDTPQPSRRAARGRPSLNPIPGMPVAEVVAFYAALNGAWPSRPALLHFATSCGIRMADPTGSMQPVREEAFRLLAAEGVEPPTRTRGGGKGKRLTFRYPVGGIPGAPLRDPEARRQQLQSNPRLVELREELRILSVSVWLAGLDAGDRRVQGAYTRWAAGTEWAKVTTLIRYGGFNRYKALASERNIRVRQAGDDPLADALAAAGRARVEIAAIYSAGTVHQPERVPFSEALQMVLNDGKAEAQPPKQ